MKLVGTFASYPVIEFLRRRKIPRSEGGLYCFSPEFQPGKILERQVLPTIGWVGFNNPL